MAWVKNLLIIIGIIALVLTFRAYAADVEYVMLTVNVPNETSAADIEPLMNMLEENGFTATFFVPGSWSEESVIDRIRTQHELGCYTFSESRLAPLEGENLTREIAGCKEVFPEAIGFRAPDNDVGGEAYTIIAEHYVYDSSMYKRYEWFWERPTDFIEVPITSVLAMPLDDTFGVKTFRLGDGFFWFARKARQETVVLSVTAPTEFVLDLEYLLRSYEEKGANITTIAGWIASSSD